MDNLETCESSLRYLNREAGVLCGVWRWSRFYLRLLWAYVEVTWPCERKWLARWEALRPAKLHMKKRQRYVEVWVAPLQLQIITGLTEKGKRKDTVIPGPLINLVLFCCKQTHLSRGKKEKRGELVLV